MIPSCSICGIAGALGHDPACPRVGRPAEGDALTEWRAAAEAVRLCERAAQNRRETLLLAARADADAFDALEEARRKLDALEAGLCRGTAIAGPVDVTGARIDGFGPAARADLSGWQRDDLTPRKAGRHIATEIFTRRPAPGDEVRMDDSPDAISAANEAGALIGRPPIDATLQREAIAKHVNFEGSLSQHADGRVETTGPTNLRRSKGPGDPGDYWPSDAPAKVGSGLRRRRKWWQRGKK